MSSTEEQQHASSEDANDEGPACHSCRKRKLRCSREHPSCTHCIRLDLPCAYDLKKNKPGIKAGVIDTLSKRIDALEEAVCRGDSMQSNLSPQLPQPQCQGTETRAIYDILSFFADEFKKVKSIQETDTSKRDRSPVPTQQRDATATPETWRRHDLDSFDMQSPRTGNHTRKRRRIGGHDDAYIDPLSEAKEDLLDQLPNPTIMEAVVTGYFSFIQPWVPVLHETRFRSRLKSDLVLREDLSVILHAMVFATLRLVDSSGLSPGQIMGQCRLSRNLIILNAMNSMSVENLQALVILAFVDMGSGEASRTWPIIGSMTRTVEYLQMSVENDYYESQPLLKPLTSLQPAKSWTEDEERRRVFWNIFNMDRFCSITTGWNTSLTADDVQRRLPADGGLWHKEKAVTTPYFGIWDKASARIGRSIAYMPAHYPSPGQSSESHEMNEWVDMSYVGAFAYNIEATESLSRVTTYFLQQKVDFSNRQEVGSWLTRFKELDLRLVHWKMFLPQKWRDTNVSVEPQRVEMDPNLTLAHLTHNASMILLHQRIAYPSPDWPEMVKLPSFCSAETCQNAAIETLTITQKYLKYTSKQSIVTGQFAFCVFVSARVLLVHSKHYNSVLIAEFDALVESLDELSARWSGHIPINPNQRKDLAAKYAQQLRDLQQNSEHDPSLLINVLGYSNNDSTATVRSQLETPRLNRQTGFASPDSTRQISQGRSISGVRNDNNKRKLASAPLPAISTPRDRGSSLDLTQNFDQQCHPMDHARLTDAGFDELSNISHTLLGQQFLEMDRVISYDDGMFAAINSLSPTLDNWQSSVNHYNYQL